MSVLPGKVELNRLHTAKYIFRGGVWNWPLAKQAQDPNPWKCKVRVKCSMKTKKERLPLGVHRYLPTSNLPVPILQTICCCQCIYNSQSHPRQQSRGLLTETLIWASGWPREECWSGVHILELGHDLGCGASLHRQSTPEIVQGNCTAISQPPYHLIWKYKWMIQYLGTYAWRYLNIQFNSQVEKSKLRIGGTVEQNFLISVMRGFQEDTVSCKGELDFKNKKQLGNDRVFLKKEIMIVKFF